MPSDDSLRPIHVLAVPLLAVLLYSHHVWAKQQPEPEQSEAPPQPLVLIAATSSPDLLPDLASLPASDLLYEETADGSGYLLFSATYFNQGDGPLELIADPETASLRGDMERDVFQRIHMEDGTYRDALAGTFEWHESHLHYHFTDFMEYDLRQEGAGDGEAQSGVLIKSTFCVRDVSRIMMDLPNQKEDAEHTECWRARQGISVGWGDTYYYNYPDQSINVSDLPSGTYVLTLTVNPTDRLIEKNYANNVSKVRFTLDKEHGTITLIDSLPRSAPPVEHVYLDEPFGI